MNELAVGAVCLSVVACAAHRPAGPAGSYEYSRELGELRHAIDDLAHTHNGSTLLDVDAPRQEIETAIASICRSEHVSCDVRVWGAPWTTRGGSGVDLSHALGDVDRVYSRLAHTFNPHFNSATANLEIARHELRELLVVRERLAVSEHLPPTRAYIFMLKDLKYVRSLIAHTPPADVPWDYHQTVADVDAAIEAIEHGGVDPEAERIVTVYQPDPADFAWLPYRDRIRVATDILDRSTDELEKDRNPAVLRGPAHDYDFEQHLSHAISALKSVPTP